MKEGLDDTPTIEGWLCDAIAEDSSVGVDGMVFSACAEGIKPSGNDCIHKFNLLREKYYFDCKFNEFLIKAWTHTLKIKKSLVILRQ